MTLTDSLKIYQYLGLNENYGENESKFLILSFNVITNEHQVLDNLNIWIQNLINRKEVKIPKSNSNSKILIGRNKTGLGDYKDELLYGSRIYSTSYNQILFILDIYKYNFSYNEFKNKYLNCKI